MTAWRFWCTVFCVGSAFAGDLDPVAAQPGGNRHIVETDPLTPAEQLQKFRLPPGFEIQLVASEPQTPKPINLSFDDQGRILVSCSVEYPYPAPADRPGRDRIVMLGDFDESGRARLVRDYVDGLSIPIGVCALRNGALVFSIPHILHAQDDDGDLKTDRRKTLYGTFGSDDTHGLSSSYRAWIDGWIYACHGFRNTSKVEGADQQPLVMNSGNTYRIKADGSTIEPFTHGQVNPFGMAFDLWGNVFTADCHTKPVYQLLRGAYYPHFNNKPHDGLGFGPEMCKHTHGSTGISGLAYYKANHFPAEFQDTLFIGNPITARVNHDRLERRGSSVEAVELPDFLACDDPWFRPVDVQMGPDGALYIADFYNRIIGHYEVPLDHPLRDRQRGRVWRVVYKPEKNSPNPKAPNLETEPVELLIGRLEDDNLVVRAKAVNQLVERIGPAAVEPMRKWMGHAGWEGNAFGLWVVERLAGLTDDEINKLAVDPSPVVRTHLLRAMAERPSARFPADLARGRLADEHPMVRRAAADAVGRQRDPKHLAPLLAAWRGAETQDTHLIHTVRMALRNQLLAPPTLAAARADFSLEHAEAPRLLEVVLGAPTSDAARWVRDGLTAGKTPNGLVLASLRFTAQHLPAEELGGLEGVVAPRRKGPPAQQADQALAVARALQERNTPQPEWLKRWTDELGGQLLGGKDEAAQRKGLELARDLRRRDWFDQTAALAMQGSKPELRTLALETCVAVDRDRSVAVLSRTAGGADEAVSLRQKAAELLASVNTPAARDELAARLKTAPASLAPAFAAGLAGSQPGAELLFQTLSEGKASRQLLLDRVVSSRLSRSGAPDWEARVKSMTEGLPTVDPRVAQLLESRKQVFLKSQGSVEEGGKVFQKLCGKCHQVAGQGARVGPQLDGVGNRGLERLLEDTLDPSRIVDQAFRTTQLVTTDGRLISGLLLRADGEVLVLADAEGKEVRVPKSEIDEQSQTSLSPMPANVADLLKEHEFNDLLAYLLEQRQAPANATVPMPAPAPKP